MGPVVPILRLLYLFLNIYDTYKVLKSPPPSARNAGQPSARAMTQRKRDMKGIMTIWIVWCCIATYEKAVDPLIIYFPFYDEIKSIFILFFIVTRARGAEPVYLHVIRPLIKPHTQTVDTLLETTHLFGDFLVVLVSWPTQILYAWYNGLTFHFPWNYSVADEDLQSVSSDESRPQSRLKQRLQTHTRHRSSTNISTASAQDSVDGFSTNQIWYPPPPAYEEEDRSQARPLPPPVPSLAPGLYPTTRSPDEWRQYPNFPAAYPLSPVLDPVPPPGFRIVAPVPTRLSDVIDIGNMSSSGQTDGNEPAETVARPGFRRSLLSSREFVNPNSAVRLSDENSIHGVQIEDKSKSSRRKRKLLSEGGEKGDGGQEDSMNVDGESGGENAADADKEESEDEGYVGDETFTTPKIRTVTVDSDGEIEGASGFEQGDSFSFQTPIFPRRTGKRTKSNLTIRKPSSTSTLNPRRNAPAPDVYPISPPRPFPPHLAPQLSATKSGSSIWSASTSLSTQGGGDSLLTGDGSEREEIETPLSPGFPSPVTYPTGTSEVIPIPDADPTLTLSVDIRGKRLFPRTQATNTRNRPPAQGMAISSSSSGGANSRGSSRSRGSRRSQGLQPGARRKNVGLPGLTRPGLRPVAKGAENAAISPPVFIQVSDPEDVRKRKQTKDTSGANRQMETHSDAPSLNKRQKTSSLRKTSSMGFKAVPPQKQRLTASQKPIQITRSTSSGTSASSSNLGARKRVSFVRNGKSAVRATRVRSGGAVNANESGV